MLTKKLIFVSGKGGTGKSTVSLYLARKLALKGGRTLLVELGSRSSVKHLAGMSFEPTYKPQPTEFGFDLSLVRGVDCLVDYVSSFVKTQKLTQYFFDNPLMKTLLDIAPGLDDLAILGKLTSHARGHGPSFDYDHIVIDSHSTGSFVSMLMAPRLLSKMVSGGPLHVQSQKIFEALLNEKVTHTLFVGLFEDLPMDELFESTADFQRKFNSEFSVLVNKHIVRGKFEGDHTVWEKFINERYQRQERLTQEMSLHYKEVYIQDLMTENLKESLLSIKNGDEIFHSINL